MHCMHACMHYDQDLGGLYICRERERERERVLGFGYGQKGEGRKSWAILYLYQALLAEVSDIRGSIEIRVD
jgi:hypothetical protein